jgi:hypothetical protein
LAAACRQRAIGGDCIARSNDMQSRVLRNTARRSCSLGVTSSPSRS